MSVSVAFVPLLPGAKLSAAAVRTAFVEQWPDEPAPTMSKSDGGVMSLDVGGETTFVALMPAPIPWSDLEGPCQTSVLWPDAAAVLERCTGHLIVTTMFGGDPVERAGRLTRVCSAVLGACEQAPGVYWGDALLVVPSNLFRDMATGILPAPPLYLWVDVRVGRNDAGTTSGFTHGLATLGHMEFETETASDSPGDLRERLYSLAGYVLENGPVIQDGNTVGQDENERIRVVYADSAFGQDGRVMRLEYESVGGKRRRK